MEKRNVPKLRFKGFEDEWKEKKIEDITSLVKDGSHGTHKDVEKGPYLLSAKNIKDGKIIIDKNDRKISLDEFNTIYKNYTLKENDILISIVGTIGRIAIMNKAKNIAFQRSVGILRFDNSNSRYIYQYMNTSIFQDLLLKSQVVSAQPGIYLNDIKKLRLGIPSVQEQTKIANFLSSVDNIIEEQEGKVKDLEQYKKGMMHKIFKQEVRFRDDNGREYPEWEERLIEEVCDIRTGKKDTKDKIENGRYPFFVRSQKVERIDTYSYEGEAILTAGDGVGVGKVFHYVNCKFDYHQRVYKLSDFKGINGKFLYEYFSKNFIREVFKYNAKTSVDSVRLEMINKMKLPCPCIEEQTKIANFLSNIDNIIEEENKKLEDLKLCKKGLLQQMFV